MSNSNSSSNNNSNSNNNQDNRLLLVEVLSNATHVGGNESFDPKCEDGNHPRSTNLRAELEQRWNDLIVATSTNPNATTIIISHDRTGTSEEDKEKDRLSSSNSSSSSSSLWFQKIYDRHTEAGRHYHTVVHLWEMFELLDIVIASCSTSTSSNSYSSWWYFPMAWSIFFHDAIYDPKSSRNEKDSAELFREFVVDYYGDDDDDDDVDTSMTLQQQQQQQQQQQTKMNKAMFDAVMTMILATEKHEVILPPPTVATTANNNNDDEIVLVEDAIAMQKYFLDIDMAVLGKHKKAYLKYAALIRKEYAFVPHDVYCSKRAEILTTFLNGSSNNDNNNNNNNNGTNKKHIYLTEEFREAFEDRARENLREEIKLLRKNVIPG